MIDTDLRNWIIPTSSYIPTIGNRFYLNQLPDSATYPCAIMFSVSRNEIHEAEVYSERFQFAAYADYRSSAVEIIDLIKSRIKRFYGGLSTSSIYTVIGTQVDNTGYIYDDTILKHVEIMDVFINYR